MKSQYNLEVYFTLLVQKEQADKTELQYEDCSYFSNIDTLQKYDCQHGHRDNDYKL